MDTNLEQKIERFRIKCEEKTGFSVQKQFFGRPNLENKNLFNSEIIASEQEFYEVKISRPRLFRVGMSETGGQFNRQYISVAPCKEATE